MQVTKYVEYELAYITQYALNVTRWQLTRWNHSLQSVRSVAPTKNGGLHYSSVMTHDWSVSAIYYFSMMNSQHVYYYYYYYFYYHYHYFVFALGSQFPRAKTIIIIFFYCPWYFILKGEEINQRDYNALGASRLVRKLGGRFPNELQKQTELKRWIDNDRRWKRKEDSRGSSETRERRWPNEERKSRPAWFIYPKVSKASGEKR